MQRAVYEARRSVYSQIHEDATSRFLQGTDELVNEEWREIRNSIEQRISALDAEFFESLATAYLD